MMAEGIGLHPLVWVWLQKKMATDKMSNSRLQNCSPHTTGWRHGDELSFHIYTDDATNSVQSLVIWLHGTAYGCFTNWTVLGLRLICMGKCRFSWNVHIFLTFLNVHIWWNLLGSAVIGVIHPMPVLWVIFPEVLCVFFSRISTMKTRLGCLSNKSDSNSDFSEFLPPAHETTARCLKWVGQ